MSFPVDNLGSVSAIVQQFADVQGFIPLPGDVWQNLQWTHRQKKIFSNQKTGLESWHNFQQKALFATIKAQEILLDLESISR